MEKVSRRGNVTQVLTSISRWQWQETKVFAYVLKIVSEQVCKVWYGSYGKCYGNYKTTSETKLSYSMLNDRHFPHKWKAYLFLSRFRLYSLRRKSKKKINIAFAKWKKEDGSVKFKSLLPWTFHLKCYQWLENS